MSAAKRQEWECGKCGATVPVSLLPLGKPHDCERDALRAERDRLAEALTYYADGNIWDYGENAREALSRDVDWLRVPGRWWAES